MDRSPPFYLHGDPMPYFVEPDMVNPLNLLPVVPMHVDPWLADVELGPHLPPNQTYYVHCNRVLDLIQRIFYYYRFPREEYQTVLHNRFTRLQTFDSDWILDYYSEAPTRNQ